MTLAEDSSPELEDELYACYNEARQDMPSTEPLVPWTRELFREWLNDPRKRRDRFWIARSGDRIAGISVLTYPESSAGVVSTNWTGTGRDFRGLGLARSLKLQTLAQAIELGVKRVRTENDSTNAAILHLNEELGYTELPGHEKLQLTL